MFWGNFLVSTFPMTGMKKAEKHGWSFIIHIPFKT